MTNDDNDAGQAADDQGSDVDMLDRLDAGLPPADLEEAAARAPYERLLARVRALPAVAPSPGWEERAAQRWRLTHGRSGRRRYAIAAGAVALAAAAVVFLALRPDERATVGQEDAAMYVTLADGTSRTGLAPVDSTLHLRAVRRARHLELRVYNGDRLVARCPGTPRCRETGRALALDVVLDAPGLYRAVVFSAAAPIVAPGPAGIDVDVVTARDAGATVTMLGSTRVGR